METEFYGGKKMNAVILRVFITFPFVEAKVNVQINTFKDVVLYCPEA